MRHGYEAKTKRITGAVALIVVLVLAMIGFFVFSKLEEEAYPEQRGQMSKDFGKLPTMEYQGKTYQMKPNLTSMLFIGYDKTDDAPTVGFRQGGQADFLVLSVLDHRNKTVHQLQIDRDTMTNVAVLGMTGNEVGTRVMQICLSHGFGADQLQVHGGCRQQSSAGRTHRSVPGHGHPRHRPAERCSGWREGSH